MYYLPTEIVWDLRRTVNLIFFNESVTNQILQNKNFSNEKKKNIALEFTNQVFSRLLTQLEKNNPSLTIIKTKLNKVSFIEKSTIN
jgi:hypothetical protein